ncbi:MAG TPA: hypothetical protein VIR30_05565 [Nocardioides sp.]|uniref:DUF4244 domain-containing protein n=1 Tax=Nocardioides daedukensis TaxID=634462 RepID=A0A7Y9UPM8_9ACTN|nr:hypothetical protein [Nocardioides daedukensis]NYG58407.1 hypothetical protein [Nocardioides daedukensis]
MEKWNELFVRLYVGIGVRARDEQGDVPGWVMITVMTAGIVGALTLVAGPRLQQMLVDALNSVGG